LGRTRCIGDSCCGHHLSRPDQVQVCLSSFLISPLFFIFSF
jgi:hypothetical protein